MSDEQVKALLSEIQVLCDRVRYLEEDNRRTHERLKAQINQYGELWRKTRRLDGEPSPEYVTADWPKESVTL
jgi:hypothetical protein